MVVSTGTSADNLSRLDARLLALDPDLAELFDEVDEILREATRKLRPPRPNEASGRPGSRCVNRRTPRPPRLHGRRPVPIRATQRSPPGAPKPPQPNRTEESEVMF